MLARRFLYVVAALVFLMLAALLGWNLFQDRIMRTAFVPSISFRAPPGAIDYRRPENWISRPGIEHDPSHWTPPGFARADQPKVAAFYVAPTTSLDRTRWNAPLDDPTSRDRLRLFTASQASAFNGVAAVWAPRYRQATIGAFLTNERDAQRALDFAYRDVVRAFDAFVASIPPDQPFFLVGHSQGSYHLERLLAEHVAGTPLAKRVVAAYLVGWPVSISADLPKLGLPGCGRADQANCVISWQSFAEPADPHQVLNIYDASQGYTGAPRKGTPMLCVNPLTGTPGSAAPASANKGAIVPRAQLSGGDLVPGKVPARCDAQGFLLIGADPGGYAPYILPGNNFHVFDYALFWANIRADAERRAAAFAQQ